VPLYGQSAETLANLITTVRDRVHDWPLEDRLTGAYTAGSGVMTVADATLFAIGDEWEVDTATGFWFLVRNVAAPFTVDIKAGHRGTTDVDQLSGVAVRKESRFGRNEITDAIDQACATLWPSVYDPATTTVTPSDTNTLFNAATDFMGFLTVAQKSTNTITDYHYYGKGDRRVGLKTGLATADFASGRAFWFPDRFYNITNNVQVTYARKVTNSLVSTGLMADTVGWGAVASLLGGSAVLASAQTRDEEAVLPVGLEAVRALREAKSNYEMGKRRLASELAATFPQFRRWRG
jgi:hypothetical protein